MAWLKGSRIPEMKLEGKSHFLFKSGDRPIKIPARGTKRGGPGRTVSEDRGSGDSRHGPFCAPTYKASLLPPRASSRVKPRRFLGATLKSYLLWRANRRVSAWTSLFSPLVPGPIIAASYYVGSFSGGERSRSCSIRVTRDGERTACRAKRDTAAIFQITRPLGCAARPSRSRATRIRTTACVKSRT